MTNHGGGTDRDSRLEAIAARVEAESETYDQVTADRKVLLEFVREQASQLKAVRRLADTSVHRISVEDIVTALEQTDSD